MFGLMRNFYRHIKKKGAPRSFTIVFLGVDNAGKTTCLAALKGEPTENATQTWGFNSEKVGLSKFAIEVFDLGGSKSIRKIWEKYYAEVHGIIFVVDASDEERLVEAKTTLEEATSHPYTRGKPLLVCANKQDSDGAISANDLIEYLDLDSYKCNHLCIECTAKGKEDSVPNKDFIQGVDWLLHTASVQYTSLEERIRKDTTLEREKQEKKMQERRLRVERMKEQRRQEEEEEKKRLDQMESRKQQLEPEPSEEEEEEGNEETANSPSVQRVHTPGSPESLYAVESQENTLTTKSQEACGGEVVAQDEEEVVLPGVIST